MTMARGKYYVTTTSDTSGFWAFDGSSSTGGYAFWGNRPPAKIPKRLRTLLTDPKVIFLACTSMFVAKTSVDGEVSDVYAIRVAELATVGIASNVETRETEYWASFQVRRGAYQVFPERDGWEDLFVGAPPRQVVLDAARNYADRYRPTMTTTSYSAW